MGGKEKKKSAKIYFPLKRGHVLGRGNLAQHVERSFKEWFFMTSHIKEETKHRVNLDIISHTTSLKP